MTPSNSVNNGSTSSSHNKHRAHTAALHTTIVGSPHPHPLSTYLPISSHSHPTHTPSSRFNPDQDDLDGLRRLLCYGRRWVQCLRLTQLPSHLDPQVIFNCMVK